MIDSISTRNGKARMMSTSRMKTVSTIPPKKPAIVPTVVPIRNGKTTPMTAICRSMRVPQMTRERMSRPKLSVPNGMRQRRRLQPRRRHPARSDRRARPAARRAPAATNAPSRPAPMASVSRRPRQRRPRRGAGATAVDAHSFTLGSSGDGDDVGEEIDQHGGAGKDHGHALHHHVVAREDRPHQQLPHAGKGEDASRRRPCRRSASRY